MTAEIGTFTKPRNDVEEEIEALLAKLLDVIDDADPVRCGVVFDAAFSLLLSSLGNHLHEDEFEDACKSYAERLLTFSAKTKDAN
jgi:hypothetical protein